MTPFYIKKYQTSEKGKATIKKYLEKYYSKPENVERRKLRNEKEKGTEKYKLERAIITKRWKENNQEKYYAHKVSANIKIPKNKYCKKCKINLAELKHHPDYSKPLKVEFLCKKCHFKEMKKYKAKYY